jgi:GTP:adenosylcobinamide-phosphate guanylyltransferase
MHAIITAGGIPGSKEPLYEMTHGGYKAMLDIHGKPMIQWVLDALNESRQIEQIVVVGLPPITDLTSQRPLTLVAGQGDMLKNIIAGAQEVLRLDPNATRALIVSSDIPTITPEMVDWMVAKVEETEHDLYYNVIQRKDMEKRFPNSRRTYIHLKELELCGGDFNAIRLSLVNQSSDLWKRIIEARKDPLKQASLLGYSTLIFLLLRQLSITEAEEVVGKRLNVKGRAILCPFPEMGMDVDKPFQLEIIRKDLARRVVHESETNR